MSSSLAVAAVSARETDSRTTRLLATSALKPSSFSISVYGDPESETDADGLLQSILAHGILVPLVVVASGAAYEVVSGHRRLACALRIGLESVPCEIRRIPSGSARGRAVLEYNQQRRKTFSQLMREADALEAILADEASQRSRINLKQNAPSSTAAERRNSDARTGRTDVTIARQLGLGGKDVFRQSRAVWKAANSGDVRARNGVAQLDAGTKSIHAAYKDLRRRDRYTTGFRPTPYDVWSFRHDQAFGLPHPGSIPPGIVAHTLHYYTRPGDLVVDPMAGGGATIDVCEAMGRRCLAYDIAPVRPDITRHDVRTGLPAETSGCHLVFLDPPYHTMLAHRYDGPGVAETNLHEWVSFLQSLVRDAYAAISPGGYATLLLANQTEKDIPAGTGYLDHVFLGYQAMLAAGFLPQRRISCPMSGAYLPQQVRRAREDGRMLGQVRDLLVMRKPFS